MSATGGRPRPRSASVLPVGATCVGAGGDACVIAVSACIVGVMLCVVATHDSAICPAGTPADTAAAACELLSWRSGSSWHACASDSAGLVEWPPAQSACGLVESRYVSVPRISLPPASLMPLVSTAMYDVRCLSGAVGTIASVLWPGSDGDSAATNSAGEASSRTTPVTAPPGPLSVTSNMRTLPASEAASIGALKVVDHGVDVPKPSSAFIATFGSL